MRLSVRQGVFETNSSSVHACVILPENEYNLWKSENLYVKTSSEDGHRKFTVMTKEEVDDKYLNEYLEGTDSTRENYDHDDYADWLRWDKDLTRYKEFGYNKYEGFYYDSDTTTFVTPSGDIMVADSYFGYDG